MKSSKSPLAIPPLDKFLPLFLDSLGSRLFWQDCFRVMRLHAPIGWILLSIPGFWGYIWGCPHGHNGTLLWIVAGSIWARSLGCFYNDWVDRDLDAQVHRTCDRPLVKSPPSASMQAVMTFILLLGSGIFIFFLPISCTFLGLASGLGTALYPWAKRITSYPQVFLGLIFNLSLWMPPLIEGVAAPMGLWLLYGYGILWTVSYDSVYAFQDAGDDELAGVGSMAVKMGPKKGWSILGGLIVVRFGLLGILAEFSGYPGFGGKSATPFHWALLVVMMGYQLWQWRHWNLLDPVKCGHFFRQSPMEGYLTTLWIVILN
jgi:4-hydroxybenzoate polyprenyltransferase